MIRIDLHIHTTISDGTDEPENMPRLVKEEHIRIFSVTDHDAIEGCSRVREALGKDSPVLINGVEISSRDEAGKYHILGYGYNLESPYVRELTEKAHHMRMAKLQSRLDILRDRYGIEFSQEDRMKLAKLPNPGKPHIGNLMVHYGYAATKDEAIEKVLNNTHAPGGIITPEEAIESIRKSGGTAVLAHPSFGSGRERIVGDEMDRRLRHLMEYGLEGVEAYYSGFSEKQTAELLSFAEKYDLLVTAGSDYHGANKKVKLGETHLQDAGDNKRVKAFLKKAAG